MGAKGVSRAVAAVSVAALVAFAGGRAAAQPPEVPNTTGPLITDTAVPAAKGKFSLQPFWTLSFVQGNFTANGARRSAGGDFVSFNLPVKFIYGLAQNLEIYAVVPYVQNWASQVKEAGPGGNRAADFGGLGDISLSLKYQLLKETQWRPTVSALFSVDFPSGHRYGLNPGRLGADALGTGAFSFTLGSNLAKWLGPVYVNANLWYSLAASPPGAVVHRQTGPLLVPPHGRDLINGNLAAEYPLTTRWVALLEFYSAWEVGPMFGRSHEPTSILLGIVPGVEFLFSPRWSCALGVALDLTGKNSPYAYTPIFTMIFNF